VVTVLADNALIGFVLGGLLALLWYYAHRVHTLTQRLMKLEHFIAQKEKTAASFKSETPAASTIPAGVKPVAATNDNQTATTTSPVAATPSENIPSAVFTTSSTELKESAATQKEHDESTQKITGQLAADNTSTVPA